MFSDNHKISLRQTNRLLIYDISGISTLLLPPLLARIAGADGIFCIFLGLLPAYLLLWGMWSCEKHTGASTSAQSRKKTSLQFGKRVGYAFFVLIGVWLAGYVLVVLSDLMHLQLLKEEPTTLIAVCILVLGAYGILDGIEGRARIYEILFWFLCIPLAIMLLLSLRDIDVDYWTPVFVADVKSMVYGTAVVFVFYLIILFVPFLRPYESSRGQGITSAKYALGVSAAVNAIIYLITLGIFGREALGSLKYPIITLMSMVKLPGGFFERQDAFMVAIWFFSLYALLGSSMFYSASCLRKMISKKGKKRYVGVVFLLVACSYFLVGCSSVELEEREFPLAAAFDYTESGYKMTLSFQDLDNVSDKGTSEKPSEPQSVQESTWNALFEQADENQPEQLDYNHIKALILSKELLDDKEVLGELLEYMKQEEIFSRNTLLFTAEKQAADVIAMDEKLQKSVGEYLNDMENGKQEKKEDCVVTLGNLMNEYENRQENIYIPIIHKAKEKPVIDNYYVLSSFRSLGVIDSDTYKLAMLLTNNLKKYSFTMDTGETAELSDISVNYKMNTDKDTAVQQVTVKAKAKQLESQTADETITAVSEKLEQEHQINQMEEYLRMWIAVMLYTSKENLDLDLTDSYYRLGAYHRELWKKYHDKKDAYQKNLEYEVVFQLKYEAS